MKFGVREICDVVFKAKQDVRIGGRDFVKGQPVLYIDSAKTSTIEGAATTVYAQGGRGNARLLTWEGEKTLTFTVEDALLSPIGFAVLSGAGLFHTGAVGERAGKTHAHMTETVLGQAGDTTITFETSKPVQEGAPVFVLGAEADGSLTGEMFTGFTASGDKYAVNKNASESGNVTLFIDYYTDVDAANVGELVIDAENFAGFYYVEASTLFRRQSDGADMPAEITIPKVKIQSNFTFTMASSGDPSTFTFTMDAMPDYTMFDKTKKVLCAIQVISDGVAGSAQKAVMYGNTNTDVVPTDSQGATSDEVLPIAISGTLAALTVGGNANIELTFTGKDGATVTEKGVTYRIVNPAIAEVDVKGKVTAKAAGNTSVVVSSDANPDVIAIVAVAVTEE